MMDKRKAWRGEEQRVVERWNAATAHYREVHAEFLRRTAEGTDAGSEELGLRVERARAELETVRRQVARLKVAFTSGKRY
jgi:hypothetical protein